MPYQDIGIEEVQDKDHRELAARVENYYLTDSGLKLRHAYDWEYNMRMREGDQHYDFAYGFDRSTARVPLATYRRFSSDIPRPTTNYIRSICRTITSMVARTRPQGRVWPNSTAPSDRWRAKIGDLCLDALHEKLREEEKRLTCAQWAWITGTVIYKTFLDSSRERAEKVAVKDIVKQRVQHSVEFCPQCQLTRTAAVEEQTESICPECEAELKQEMRDKLDKQGQPIWEAKEIHRKDDEGKHLYQEKAVHEVNSAVVSPFNFSVDPKADNLDDARWVMEAHLVGLPWLRENFGRTGKGYTGQAHLVKPEQMLNPILSIKERIKTILSSSGFYATGAGYTYDLKNVAVLKEYYERPTAEHPKGRMILIANSIVLYVGPSPYHDQASGIWHPYNDFRWEILPGRYWGSTPADDMVKLQRRINAIDSIMILTRQTTASPQWLVPFGSRVPRGVFSGRPNLIIHYSPVGGNGAKPERIPPASWPVQLIQEREQTIRDMREISGTVSVLEGIRPTGVGAAAAISLLLEQATGAHATTIIAWEKFWERVAQKKLVMIQKVYRQPNADFINRLRSLNKDIPDEMIAKFVGESLQDNVNVRIEAMSTAPRLHAAKVANLTDQLRYGAIDVTNPLNRQRYLEMVGLGDFDQQFSRDIERVDRENENLDHMDDRVEVMRWDDHQVHIKGHTDRMKRPDFWKLPDDVREGYYQHVLKHEEWQMRLSVEMAQKQKMVQMAMMPPPEEAEAEGGPEGGVPVEAEPEENEEERELEELNRAVA